MCAHFCYKMVHCGLYVQCIMGFKRWVNWWTYTEIWRLHHWMPYQHWRCPFHEYVYVYVWMVWNHNSCTQPWPLQYDVILHRIWAVITMISTWYDRVHCRTINLAVMLHNNADAYVCPVISFIMAIHTDWLLSETPFAQDLTEIRYG